MDDLNSGMISFSAFTHHVFFQSNQDCPLQGEFAQIVCSSLSEGFYSGNCKT